MLRTPGTDRRAGRFCLVASIGLVAACGPAGTGPAGDSDGPTATETGLFAEAEIAALGDADVRGQLRFDQDAEFLRISGRIHGLQPGRYLLHIHDGRQCAVTPDGFAGSIFSPAADSADLALDSELPNAAGNLGEFVADDGGEATFDLVETNLSLGDGARSVTSRSVVVHRARGDGDVPVLQPGETLACGTVESTPTPTYVR